MKEITDIIKAYDAAVVAGKKAALATVVHVEGSSYRRPGARMLVTDDGLLTGAISGGCLEGDALRKALLAISQQKNKLVTYDTTDESDPTLGIQLGCNGIVHILFEPIQDDQTLNPINLLRQIISKRKDAVLVTLFSLESKNGTQIGTCFLSQDGSVTHKLDTRVDGILDHEAGLILERKDSDFKNIVIENRTVTAFFEYLPSPVWLVIVGAGNDTIPLMEMASVLGWRITVVDGRAGHATKQRFPKADEILVTRADDVLSKLTPDSMTFFALLTHNYNYDLTLLSALIMFDQCPYIGALGPKKKLHRMYSDLKQQGIEVTEKQKEKIYGPIGLDIGAETSEEIALSILSEIKTVVHGRIGISLRQKATPIHNRASEQMSRIEGEASEFVCAIASADFQ